MAGILLFGGLLFVLPTTYYLLPTHHALALEVGVAEVEETIAITGADIRVVIARIIRVALGLLGAIAVLIVLYGGFLWMTAGGEVDKVDKAKRTLINGGIGLAIILLAFSITQFILNSLIAATTGAGRGLGAPERPIVRNSGSLGRGIVDSHYPPRGAVGVARNTNVIITFNVPIQLSSIVSGYDDAGTPDNLEDDTAASGLNTRAMEITFLRADGSASALLGSDEVAVRFTPDRRTFVLDPVGLLGSPSENVRYTVRLPGDGLRREDGSAAFRGAFSGGYEWQFETGTFIDLTPPFVTDYFPFPEARSSPPFPTPAYERNVLIQVNFNEAVDPTSIVGPGNLVVRADGAQVVGFWNIANEYRSAEFITESACGVNSCGETIYCLPADADIAVRVRAADLTSDPSDGAAAEFPYNGVADAAGNSLNDEGENTVAEGSPADDVNFNFGTSGAIDIMGPVITEIEPGVLSGEVAPDIPVRINFNEMMSRVSINTQSIRLLPDPDHELWYSLRSGNLYPPGAPADGGGALPVGTFAEIRHGLLLQTGITAASSQGYVPVVGTGVRDAYQNCFVPTAGPGATESSTCTPNPYCCNGVPSTQPFCGLEGAGSGVGIE